MEPRYTPTRVQVHRANKEVIIEWADGHRSVYAFGYLRRACPCASCVGGHEHMGQLPDPKTLFLPLTDARAEDLVNLLPVGNYALNPVWGDGHSHGIYRWDYLRQLCPCSICRAEAKGDENKPA